MPNRPAKLACDITATGEINGSPWLSPVRINTEIPFCFGASHRSNVEVQALPFRRYEMSARGIPTRSQGRPAERVPSVDSVRSAKPATGEIAKPSRLQTPRPQPTNGDTVFDPEAFLARAGLGRKVLSLTKNETACAQGDPADAFFYVQKGQLRVTGRNWDFSYTPTTHLTAPRLLATVSEGWKFVLFRRNKESCRSVSAAPFGGMK